MRRAIRRSRLPVSTNRSTPRKVRTNENKINGERQRASASAQNGGEKMSETDIRSVPKDGEGREKQINKEHGW
ncbi:hypothetical protein TNCV_3664231 [Trichonephila clavipes]|nr:hypothetical protein TNCV_3664231 [Trichonephila clavipes]